MGSKRSDVVLILQLEKKLCHNLCCVSEINNGHTIFRSKPEECQQNKRKTKTKHKNDFKCKWALLDADQLAEIKT